MKYEELPISFEDLEPKTDRSPGLHGSDLIKHVLMHWDPKRFGGEVTEETRQAWLVGFAFEEMVGAALARIASRGSKDITQLEIEKEGVYWTIDCFDFSTWRVREYKSTEMSSKWPLNNYRFWHWVIQVKAYCYVADTKEAELYALFMRGDYKEKRKDLKGWLLRFSERELEENWVMLMNAKRDIERGEK